ncbi:MAG: transporter permease [Phycisphaerales bacterium]|nr:transporter permease [Phycisphaerales bacterium]
MTAIAHDLPNEAGAEPMPPMPEAPRSMAREFWRRLKKSLLAQVCLTICVIYGLIGVASFLPLFEGKINESLSAEKTYGPPAVFERGANNQITGLKSPAYWLGLDFQGRSVFWRVLYGTRVALLITICASILSLGIGTVLGIMAGFFGGWVDDVITWLFSTVSSIPWLLLVIAMAYAIQGNEPMSGLRRHETLQKIFGGLTTIILALGLTDWVGLCRLMRGEVIKLRDRDFVIAGRALGLGNARILFRHILPNTFHLVIITFSINAVAYVQVEVILAFLGLGVTDKPSWGRMIDDAKLELLRGVWWQLAAATVAIFILSLAVNLLGDFLRDALDPRLRGQD